MRVLYGLFLFSVVCLTQTPAPVISFDKTHHDFGRVSQGQRMSYKYQISNNGNAELHIKEIQVSCSCSSPVLGQHRLNPGESTFIQVYFNSTGMIGSVHKSLNVISDDPQNTDVQLTFEASVVSEIMPSKSTVFFDEISRYSTASSTIRLESGNEMPVIVTGIKIPDVPYISCDARKDGNDVILYVTIDGRVIPKETNRGLETILVNTTNEKFHTIRFNVQWNTQPIITISQKRIAWNETAGKELKTTVTLSHSGGRSFRILGAESTSPYIKADGYSDNSSAEHKLDVILAKNAKAGMYYEKLILKLDAPEQLELEIDITAILR